LAQTGKTNTKTSRDNLPIDRFTECRLKHARYQQFDSPLRENIPFFLKELGPRFLQTRKGSNGNVEPLSNYRISLGGIHPAIIRQGKTE
jgi:hypothetical protein